MSEAKLDQVLSGLSTLQQDVSALKQDVSALKQDVSALKQDVSALKQDVSALKQRQDEMLGAFRAHWSDMAGLHRAAREDLKHFEDRVEGKLSQVNQSIQALKDSLERQDFRSDELGRRIDRLELGDKPRI